MNFLNNKIFYKFITLPLSKNTKACQNEIELMLKFFPNLSDIDVLEVGAGFGNFCRVLNSTIKIKSYTILDTESMQRFAKTFLRHFNINVTFVTTMEFKSLFSRKFDIFISNTCLSETPFSYRKDLLSNVLPYYKKIFVIDADRRAHPYLDKGKFNIWLEKTIKKHFSKVQIKRIPYKTCFQKFTLLYIGEK